MASTVETSVKISPTIVGPVATNTTQVLPPNCLRRPILIRPRVMMGSGPTNPTQRVTEALSKPQMGIFSDDVHQVNDDFSMHCRHDQNFTKENYDCRVFNLQTAFQSRQTEIIYYKYI